MKSPLVSVIVPTRNQAEFLGPCLDSIFFQDYPALEVVVVNDASTDGTAALLREFARAVRQDQVSYFRCFNPDAPRARQEERQFHSRYPAGRQLRIVTHRTRQGTSRPYNHGFRLARGEYCTYVASDDLLLPEMVSSLARELQRSRSDFVYSDMWVIDEGNRILREFRLPRYDFRTCLADWYLMGVSKLYRRSLHKKIGWYHPDYLANDYELYLRFAQAGARFRHLPRVLYAVRQHGPGRQTGVHAPGSWQRLIEESKTLALRARDWLAAGGRP